MKKGKNIVPVPKLKKGTLGIGTKVSNITKGLHSSRTNSSDTLKGYHKI